MAVLHLTSALPQDIFTVGVEILANSLAIMMLRFSSKMMMMIIMIMMIITTMIITGGPSGT